MVQNKREEVMGKREKELEKIRRNPTDVTPQDLERLVKKFDFIWIEKTNHAVITHEWMEETFMIPRHKPLKAIYVKKVVRYIDEILAMEGEKNEK